MTGLASLGAMAVLVSTIGSNLGVYILVGHVAGWLTTLGITSSVTTLTSFVAAIGTNNYRNWHSGCSWLRHISMDF